MAASQIYASLVLSRTPNETIKDDAQKTKNVGSKDKSRPKSTYFGDDDNSRVNSSGSDIQATSTVDPVLKKCREYFRDLDKDGSGKLSRNEFLQMLKNIGLELDVKQLEKAYRTADANGDGEISFKEFSDAYSHVVNAETKTAEVTRNRRGKKLQRSHTTVGQSQSRPDLIRSDTHRATDNGSSDSVLKKCREYFRNVDTDGSGKLSRHEFVEMIKTVGVDLDVRQLEKAYRHADVDGDGEISFREFVDAYNHIIANQDVKVGDSKHLSNTMGRCQSSDIPPNKSTKHPPPPENEKASDTVLKKCREYFRNLDQDGSGKLSRREFSQMIENIGIDLDTKQLETAYRHADVDGDGEISFKEFVDAYNHVIANQEVKAPAKQLVDAYNHVLANQEVKAPAKKQGKGRVKKAYKEAGRRHTTYTPQVTATADERTSGQEKTTTDPNTNTTLMKRCREYFRTIDIDGSGKLSRPEFLKMMESTGAKLDIGQIEKVYRMADRDGDGEISFKEFMDAYNHIVSNNEPKPQRRYTLHAPPKQLIQHNIQAQENTASGLSSEFLARCREYFNSIDEDGSGKISRHEFLNMIERLGMKLDGKQLDRAYHIADRNKDGEISFKEFIDAYNHVIGGGTNDPVPNSVSRRQSRVHDRRSSIPTTIPVIHEHSNTTDNHSENPSNLLLSKCREYFYDMNPHGDGTLTRIDFLKMAKRFPVELDMNLLEKLYSLADRRMDGVISYDEFIHVYTERYLRMKEEMAGESAAAAAAAVLARGGGGGGGLSRSSSQRLRNKPDMSRDMSRERSHSNEFSEEDEILMKCDEYIRDMDTLVPGKLSSSEFLKMIEYVGMELDVTGLVRIYNSLNRRGDGSINYTEFVNAYTQGVLAPGRAPEEKQYLEPMLGRRGSQPHAISGSGHSPAPRRRVSSLGSHDAPFAPPAPEVNDAASAKIHSLTTSQTKGLCKYFWSSDRDRDGKLSSFEFSKMLEALGMKLNNKDLHKAFKIADIDGDGLISFNEFLGAYLSKNIFQVLSPDQLKKHFGLSDQTKYCFLSRNECFEVMRGLGNDLEERNVAKLIHAMDRRSDGTVTLMKFYAFLGVSL